MIALLELVLVSPRAARPRVDGDAQGAEPAHVLAVVQRSTANVPRWLPPLLHGHWLRVRHAPQRTPPLPPARTALTAAAEASAQFGVLLAVRACRAAAAAAAA